MFCDFIASMGCKFLGCVRMRFKWGLSIVGLVLLSVCARAADGPVLQPPADWVKPAIIDFTPSKLAKDAPTAVLLHDIQVRFQPDVTAFYSEIVTKAQTAQGLGVIGSVSLPWDPATQRLIVHKLKVIRGGKDVDYLASGPGFLTLRRETRLEAATLDGALTATTQLEGLEVGDILDLAYTIEYVDPIMKGYVQSDFGLNEGPLHRSRLRYIWPSSMKVNWRALDHAPNLVVRSRDGLTEAVLEREDPVDPIPPKGAPYRYLRGPELQLGNFAGWSDVSALLSGEFTEAEVSAPDSALMAEVKAIATRTADPRERAEAALTLVQDKVRYVLLALDGGGLKPAPADLTWTRRFADCKGKTVMLLAMLHALGIEAEPALVSSGAGDGLDQRLPMLEAFDHVLVRATIDGRVYWLDGTRTGDRVLDKIRTPGFLWALPVRAAGGELIRLEPQDLDQPVSEMSIRLDATSGLTLPASAHGELVLRGDAAIFLDRSFASLPPDKLEAALKRYWHQRYDEISVESATLRFDPVAQEARMVMDGEATLDWRTGGGYEVPDMAFEKPDFLRQPGPDSDAPYAVDYPYDNRFALTILLPNNGQGYRFIGPQFDEVRAGARWTRHLAIDKGVFSANSELRTVVLEFPASDAEADAKRLGELGGLAVRVAPGQGIRTTPTERAALEASTPQTVEQYIVRGNAFLDEGKYDQALADFDKAVTMEPGSSAAWAHRALTWAWKGETDKAQADADESLRLDPRQLVAFHARGLAALKAKHWSDAVAGFSGALEIDGGDLFSLSRRAEASLHLYDSRRALQDADAGLAVDPDQMILIAHKCTALTELGRREEAAALARQLISDHPDNGYALLWGAEKLQHAGYQEEAWGVIDKAVSLKPNAEALVTRADMHTLDDPERGAKDARKALELGGKTKEALRTLTRLNYWSGNYAEALRWGKQALESNPDDDAVHVLIAALHHALGDDAVAASDYAKARTAAGADGEALFRLCWSEATAGFDLPGAMGDCDAALRAWPNYPPALAGRGFLLLRQGHDEEAVTAFEAALAVRPSSAAALYGRSLAERHLGRVEAADRDSGEAIRWETDVADWYRHYGVPN